MKYNIVKTKSGHKTLKIEYNNKLLTLNSIYDPLKEANNLCKKIFPDNKSSEYLFIIGTDFFYLLNSIIENREIYNSVKKILITDYWQELVEVSLKESPYSQLLNDEKVIPLFNKSIVEIIDYLNSLNIDFNKLTIILSIVSGKQYSKNRNFFKMFKENILIRVISVPGDIFQAIQAIQLYPSKHPLNDTNAIILLMNEIITKYERKDLNYDIL